ncbi:MAG: hypothetical protein M2R45_04405 [Verrucomicrobia subdivision 3 bacterium]|nr:hypothetical protein [Limisphaerales bacterium]MCS1417257.1 hypothetical protein [Limisphaerales bacterium]
MKARRITDIDPEAEQQSFISSEIPELSGSDEHRTPQALMDDAAEAVKAMAAKSAVLVEMMEDLKGHLRRRMANLNDSPSTTYTRRGRKVRQEYVPWPMGDEPASERARPKAGGTVG